MELQRYGLLLLVVWTLAACSSVGPEQDRSFLEPMHEARPGSILVVPVRNQAVDVEAPTSVLATLPVTLAEHGYYVFPVNTVKYVLEREGYYEPAEIHQLPASTLADLFGADAVLYVTIHEWASRYVLLSTTTVVDFEYRLVGADGAELWQARQETTHTPDSQQESSGSFLQDMFSSAISAALERASPQYLQLTREAHQQALHDRRRGLPPGPYHERYQGYYETLEERQE